LELKRWRVRLFLFLLAALSLAACSPIVKAGQPNQQDFFLLQAGHTLGQTFMATYDGLTGIALYLKPAETGEGTLTLHLRASPEAVADLSTSTIPLRSITSARYYRFPFQIQGASRKQDYYLVLDIEGQGSLEAGLAPGETYLNGALYQDDLPQDSQLTFRLLYNPQQLALGLAGEVLSWLLMVAVAGFAFLPPGWGLLACTLPGWEKLSWCEKLGLSVGMSLAIYPLLILWTSTIRLHLGVATAWLPIAAGVSLLFWKNRATFRRPLAAWKAARRRLSSDAQADRVTDILLPDLAYTLLLLVLVFTRFWPIRSLDLPMWGDSIQHTMIVQLLMDHGGLFDSWAPYADLQSFTYHFGFHAATAVFAWLTRLSASQATLYTGQILNVLAVITLYPLAMRISPSRWSGVIAVAVAGLLSSFPQEYANWGRYTQLTGQIILPLAIWLALQTVQLERFSGKQSLLSAVALAGLALSHYRVLIFGLIGLLAAWLVHLNRTRFRNVLASFTAQGMASLALFLPWLIHLSAGRIYMILSNQVSTPASQTRDFVETSNTVGNILIYLPAWLWMLAGICLVWGLLRRQTGVFFIGLWSGLVFLAANPQWFNQPGLRTINNFTVLIAAYIPAALLAGSLPGAVASAGALFKDSAISIRRWLSTALGLGVVAISLWGVVPRIADIDIPAHALGTRPDLRAADWITQNITAEARFLVNSFSAFGGSSVAGSDGGWWLSTLTARQTTLPPLNYAFEKGPIPNYRTWVNSLTDAVNSQGPADPAVLAELARRGVTHVYIGQQQGRVNYTGPALDPQVLLKSPAYTLLYHQNRVWIFKFTAPK
jgi:hypothetical protein